MQAFTDQLGRTIKLENTPSRIISLVPSQTELLYDLGLQEEVVGITKFCAHPEEWFRSKARIGGTKNVRMQAIHDLQPDLILANKEENIKEQVEELEKNYPVWVSDIHSLNDALGMIKGIGAITGKTARAEEIAKEIGDRFAALDQAISILPPVSAAYFIWRNPWMVAGGDTFIQEMMTRAGLINVFQDQARYPSIDPGELAQKNCKLILLSSEPYPFKDKHIAELAQVLPEASIRLVDGELYSWYGSRLLHSPAYFQDLRIQIENNRV